MHLLLVFIKAGYKKCRVKLDCAEVFIERPNSLINQACTGQNTNTVIQLDFLLV